MRITIQEQHSIELPSQLKKHAFLYHTKIWQEFISKSFHTEQLWVTAQNESNEIITAMPITKIKSKIFGNRIISTGYQEYGGIIGVKENLGKILEYIKQKYSTEFEHLEIKGTINQYNKLQSSEPNLVPRNHYKRFILQIADKKELWNNIQKSKRKAIKKSQKECICRELTTKDLNLFYKLYLENMRSFGTPPYNKQYFQNFFEIIQPQGHGKIYGCFPTSKPNTLISALLGFNYNQTVHITTAISNPKYASLRPSDLMHWAFINWAQENNYHFFDFGLVREESGQFEYKRKWGAQLQELPSFYYLINATKIPEILDPSNKKYKLAIKVWRHLPLKITELIGMKLRTKLGI